MPDIESNGLEYLRRAFKGLSVEKKDSVLITARSLLKIQNDNNYPDKRGEFAFWESMSASADKKI